MTTSNTKFYIGHGIELFLFYKMYKTGVSMQRISNNIKQGTIVMEKAPIDDDEFLDDDYGYEYEYVVEEKSLSLMNETITRLMNVVRAHGIILDEDLQIKSNYIIDKIHNVLDLPKE